MQSDIETIVSPLGLSDVKVEKMEKSAIQEEISATVSSSTKLLLNSLARVGLNSSVTGTDDKKMGIRKSRKPAGMSREVFNLVGEVAHSIVPTRPMPAPKSKQEGILLNSATSGPAARWNISAFENTARQDQLLLKHWTKAGDKEEFKFAKFNKSNDVLEYTDEEYDKLLRSTSWSREDTDILFDYCRQYDRRFFVVADRIPLNRPVEDLKARYLECTKKLIETRLLKGNPESTVDLHAYHFNLEKEKERKKHIEALYQRTPEQLAEEEKLVQEVRRIESQAKNYVKNRHHLVRLLSSFDMTLTPRQAPVPAAAEESVAVKRIAVKKKPAPTGPTDDLIELTSLPPAIKQSLKKHAGFPQGTSLRSARLSTPLPLNAKLLKRYDEQLEHYNIPRTLPRIASADIVGEFEDLRRELIILLDIKKNTDALSYEMEVLKTRKVQLERELSQKQLPTTISPEELAQASSSAAKRREEIISESGDYAISRSSTPSSNVPMSPGKEESALSPSETAVRKRSLSSPIPKDPKKLKKLDS